MPDSTTPVAARPPIAIVGMACRLPGGNDSPEAFWDFLRRGGDGIGEVPKDRWDIDYYYHPDPSQPGRMYTRKGGFIRNVDLFDAAFFGISPREATRTDPQQRLLLELAWEALEDAGIVPAKLAGTRTGVVVGVSSFDYWRVSGNVAALNAYSISGTVASIAANRISYIFDLRGPSFVVDTACSSSLVALHEACEALRRGDMDAAIVGGVNLLLDPAASIGFCRASMLSPTGRCHSFDAAADGYVRAEGAGVVVLRRLDDALAEDNPVRATIVATGVNCDGRTAGMSLPSAESQEALLRDVYARSGIDPAVVDYVEAHGTGTPAGDPVECTAIGRVFGAARQGRGPCLIGSVKANIGHLEAGAGMPSLIKAALSLEHREVPATPNFEKPNPRIAFEQLNLAVVARPTPLAPGAGGLTIGINGFGFGGANAHAVLREAPARRAAPDARPPRGGPSLLFVSARSAPALTQLAGRYAAFLRDHNSADLAAICRSAALHRSHHPHRMAVFGSTKEELAAKLDGAVAEDSGAQAAPAAASGRVAFVFSGNGSQWVGMGRELLRADADFAAAVAQVDALLRPRVGWSVIDELNADGARNRFALTSVAQPALFALQVAMQRWLRERGLEPEAVVGHSVGEVAAAHAAGILSLEDAVQVIVARSLSQELAAGTGGMAAAGVSAEVAAELIAGCRGRLELAAVNSPTSVTVAGEPAALEELGRLVESRGGLFKVLALNYAFHSWLMEPIRESLAAGLKGLRPGAGALRFVSTVSGDRVEGTRLDADYWWDNVRKPVRFESAVSRLAADGIGVFVEIGPHPILDGYVRECTRKRGSGAASVGTLRRNEPELEALYNSLARSYAAGAAMDFGRLHPGRGRPVRLPPYPWQRERFWAEGADDLVARPQHPLLGCRVPASEPVWRNHLDSGGTPWLADHVIGGAALFPATGYVEMAVAAATLHLRAEAGEIENLAIWKPLVVPQGGSAEIEFAADTAGAFRVYARESRDAKPELVASGRMAGADGAEWTRAGAYDVTALRARAARQIDVDDFYRRCAALGLAYGPSFRAVAELWAGERETLARIVVPQPIAGSTRDFRLHPALLDASVHILFALVAPDDGASFLPVRIDRVRYGGNASRLAYAHARIVKQGKRSLVADVTLLAEDGGVVARAEGVRLQRADLLGTGDVGEFEWHPVRQERDGLRSQSPAASIVPMALESVADGASDAHALRVRAALDALAGAYAARAVRELNGGDGAFGIEELATRGRVGAGMRAYLRTVIEVAAAAGHIERQGEQWIATREGAQADPDAEWRRLVAQVPGAETALRLIAQCGDQLAALVRGEGSAEELLFPDSEGAPGEQFWAVDAAARPIAATVRSLFQGVAAHWPADRPLRILELGGSTLALTQAVLALLPADKVEFVYLARDHAMGGRMQARLADYEHAQVLVAEEGGPALETGRTGDGFDVVFSACPVPDPTRATPAVESGARLLARGGAFVQVDFALSPFMKLVFGAVPAWTEYVGKPAAPWAPLAPLHMNEAGALALEGGRIRLAIRSAESAQAPPSPVAKASGSTWVVLDDGGADEPSRFGGPLVDFARAAGQRVVRVHAGESFKRLGSDRFCVDAADAGGFARLVRILADEGAPCRTVVHLWGIEAGAEGPAEPLALQDRRSLSVIWLAQALTKQRISPAAIWIVTAAAAQVPRDGVNLRPEQAPVWGVARTLANEAPELTFRLVDIDPAAPASSMAAGLIAELADPTAEDEILLRGNGRYVNRLRRSVRHARRSVPAADAPAPALVLEFDRSAAGRPFYLRAGAATRPGEGEIEVEVAAAGVNFRDVLQRVGLLPDEAFEGGFAGATLGMEFAGRILAVGRGVTSLAPGMAVCGVSASAMSTRLTVAADSAIPLPAGLTMTEAATMPVVHLTAWYSLADVARLQAGERVLIHGAAGGVGLAAIQAAQLLGADVLATAGTLEKRAFLRRLGVVHVFDSRSLAFADEVMSATGGEGVDVVLNSLAGEALHRSVGLLRPFGRFVELGKRDFYADSRLGLRPFRNNVSFHGVDIDRLLVDRPVVARRLLAEVGRKFAAGGLRPLPHRVFPVAEAASAFRLMQHSRHIGKVVLDMSAGGLPIEDRDATPAPVRADRTYLVTGGRRGFGLATAEWLAARGARHLALVSRSGPAGDEARGTIDRLKAQGAAVREIACDVADRRATAAMLDDLARGMPPLAGVVHAAMVLDDGAFAGLDRERCLSVLRPKLSGAWNLHELTAETKLDFFVLYSSAVTLIGNPGQTAYVAANVYLEQLARWRRSRGLPGLAVSWSAIGDVGYLARNADVRRTLADRLGVRAIATAAAFPHLERLLAAGVPHAAVADFNWSRLRRNAAVGKAPKFAGLLRRTGTSAEASAEDLEDIRQRIAVLAREEAVALVQKLVTDEVAGVLRMAPGKLSPTQSLVELGMDSLMVVELQLQLESRFGITIPAMEMMDRATVAKLAAHVVELLSPAARSDGAAEEGMGRPVPEVADAAEIDRLSEEDVDTVLRQLIGERTGQPSTVGP